MPRSTRPSAALLAGLVAALLPGRPAPAAPPALRPAVVAPLSGIVRADGRPVPGATLVVRGVMSGGAMLMRTVKSDSDGTFVLSDAAEGLYTVLSVVPGFRPAVARLFHRPAGPEGALSFVRIDLERPSGVLPETETGALDAWSARAVVSGDVLREVPAILAALDAAPAPAAYVPLLASARDARAAVPLHAAVTTTAGFGAAGSSSLSQTSLDVSGTLGAGVKWGASGQYARLADLAGEKTGDSARLALEVDAGASQSVHVSTRRQNLSAEVDPTRFAAHALDWSGAVSERGQAAVSARVISQAHVLATGPTPDLFARSSDAVDVAARYQTDLGAATFARVTVGYRSTSGDYAGTVTPFEHETRAGGVAGLRLGEVLVVEAGATGDTSFYGRGITPELMVALQTRDGWRVYGFAARRFESTAQTLVVRPGEAGTDEADLTRRSRSLYRGGVRWQNREGESVAVDVSRREINGTYRLLFDADFLDRLDSLYFFPNDVATDAAFTVSTRLGSAFDGRVSFRAGALSGARDGAIRSDEAHWGVAQAALRVRATDTSVGVGYRQVAQSLQRGATTLRNDLQAVDVTLAQGLPLPILRAVGNDWRALFSVEFGKRREGEDEEKTNRRLAGGLALSF
ncbi:MAG: carboxypeptidase regulatory-like domain-containing protein [Acidobacteria bacterium]|nr:carboxypeptidase regulatory-like domain-containing protein [Acidobacteriota bacterium]MBK9963711.1 carboxypeptidase regulatory-like domain-containing protein [Holophagales bacterium]